MEDLIKKIIQRVGEANANPSGSFNLLNMASLPTK
jgi:hypothetical protein